jgi:hypothetical protein
MVARMTADERAQLIEDIKRSDSLRRGIVQRAELSPDFDILAAWEEVEALDGTINIRIVAARSDVAATAGAADAQ